MDASRYILALPKKGGDPKESMHHVVQMNFWKSKHGKSPYPNFPTSLCFNMTFRFYEYHSTEKNNATLNLEARG